jgi:hypothetical protein
MGCAMEPCAPSPSSSQGSRGHRWARTPAAPLGVTRNVGHEKANQLVVQPQRSDRRAPPLFPANRSFLGVAGGSLGLQFATPDVVAGSQARRVGPAGVPAARSRHSSAHALHAGPPKRCCSSRDGAIGISSCAPFPTHSLRRRRQPHVARVCASLVLVTRRAASRLRARASAQGVRPSNA